MSEHLRVWRAPVGYRIFFTAFAAAMIGGALLPWNDGVVTFPLDGAGDYWHDLGYRILAVVFAGVSLAWVYRPRMDLYRDAIDMRYTLWSRRILLSEVTSVTPGREGLDVETRDGSTHSSPMFIGQKAPLASWLHRRSRADQIAETIMNARP